MSTKQTTVSQEALVLLSKAYNFQYIQINFNDLSNLQQVLASLETPSFSFKVYDRPIDDIEEPSIEMQNTIKAVKKLKNNFNRFKQTSNTFSSELLSKPNTVRVDIQGNKQPPSPKLPKPKVSPLVTLTNFNSSRRKPLLNLQITLNDSKTIVQDVANGDTSYELAKNVFKNAKIKASVSDIQQLSDSIFNTVSLYLQQVSKELSLYSKQAHKIQQSQNSQKDLKIHPPILETEKRALKRKPTVGTINFNIEDEEVTLTVYQGDDPQALATQFCNNHGIELEYIEEVITPIRDLLKSAGKGHICTLNFEVDEDQTASIDIREGDDLFALAHQFVRENRLGPDNVGRVYRSIKKTYDSFK